MQAAAAESVEQVFYDFGVGASERDRKNVRRPQLVLIDETWSTGPKDIRPGILLE